MNGSLSKWLRICAGLLLVVGVVAAGLYLTTSPQEGISAFAWLLPAGLYFMLAIGLSLVLLAVAQQYEKPVDMPRELFDALTQMGDAINTLNTQVSQLAQTIDQMRQSPADGESAPAAYPPHNPTDSAQLSEQINELRRLVLMSESQRQALLTQHQHQQFNQTLETIQRQIADRQFGSAERLMGELSEHQSSPELAELRQRLAEARSRAQVEAMEQTTSRIEDLMAIGSWDQAHALAGQLAADYPDNPDAAGLLRRVTRERDLFRESTVQRLYDEVKHEVERRNWRRAHSSAVKLLERFSDHRKSEKIRAQFSTIAENAEIEERQEQESRIQELIKARRFGEAVELAEQLMRQFPDSPQAQSLEELLPTLRDKALEEEIGSFKRPGVLR